MAPKDNSAVHPVAEATISEVPVVLETPEKYRIPVPHVFRLDVVLVIHVRRAPQETVEATV